MSATTAQQIVLDAVEGAGFPAPFKELILLALSQPGRILDQDHPSLFHDIILACCSAAHGRTQLSPRVAAAFELCIAASDLLDEIEDADESVVCSYAGMPRALNASTAILAAAFSTLSAPEIGSEHRSLFLEMINMLSSTIVTSTVGQDADLASTGGEERSIQFAVEIARLKSGSLVAGASVMGAALGTTDPQALSLYRDFGTHLGTAYQLSNDLRDARSSAKSDIASGKGTVPLVFQNSDSRGSLEPVGESVLRASGALQFTWVLMETERNACRRVIELLRSHNQDVAPLESLVSHP